MNLLWVAILALIIHAGPVGLKYALDPLYLIDSRALATLLALTLLQMTLLSLPGKKGRLLAIIVFIPLAFTTLLNVISLVIFSSPVSLSGVFAILQSNSSEAMEFTAAYSTRIALAAVITVLILGGSLAFFARSPTFKNWKATVLMFTLSLLASGPLLRKASHDPVLAAWDLHEVAFTDRVLTSVIRYRSQMQAWNEERLRWQNRGDIAEDLQLKVIDEKKLAPLVVVVIGESTTRHNLEIYGYHRPTTPKLAQMKDDLVIFNDVITPVAHTIPAVMGALCSEKLRAGEINCTSATLVDIARGAGYHVTWISNQTPVGFDDNVLVHLGKSADKAIFVNHDVSSAAEADRNTSLDEKIFAPLDDAMSEADRTGEKNMIFIHLMGAHFTYEKRYPAASKIFNDNVPNDLNPVIKDKDANLLINNYDNAIAYQDEILSRIFTRIKSAKHEALGVYFSDHGEEVYESKNFHGHNDMNLTRSMSEIPLILATSDSYSRTHVKGMKAIRSYQNRPFTTSRLTPSIADLLGLKYPALDPERGLFSPRFKPEPRETAAGVYSKMHDGFVGQQ